MYRFSYKLIKKSKLNEENFNSLAKYTHGILDFESMHILLGAKKKKKKLLAPLFYFIFL